MHNSHATPECCLSGELCLRSEFQCAPLIQHLIQPSVTSKNRQDGVSLTGLQFSFKLTAL